MTIEINRIRVTGEGVRFEVSCPNWGSAIRAMDEVLRIEPAAFAPREPTPYSHAESLERRRSAAEAATGRLIPRGHMPPYDTTLGGQPLPGGYLMADMEEPPLRAFSADELKVGGSD